MRNKLDSLFTFASDNAPGLWICGVVLFSVVGIFFEFGPMSYQHFTVGGK